MSKIYKIVLMLLLVAACSKFDKRDALSITDDNDEKAAYKVELAQTDDEMRTGLMNRDKLDENSGMLFNLGRSDVPTAMWMKDTKIPLDMIFIDKDGTIFWIYENAEPESTKLIVAPFPAFAVLEVNAGDVKRFDIKIGDTVKHKWFEEEKNAAGDKDAVSAPDGDEVADSEAVAAEEIENKNAEDAPAAPEQDAPAPTENEEISEPEEISDPGQAPEVKNITLD